MTPSTNATRAATRRTSQRVAQGGVLAVLLGAAALFGAHRAAPSIAVAGQGDVAGLFDIGGGRRMYLECRGQGSPTVVLVSGYPDQGSIWSIDSPEVPQPQVLPAVARFTRVCAYDRPGTIGADPSDRSRSRSDPVPQPRAAEDTVADLHALLRAAQVPGPYVLAGHSLGGLLVRLYAATYPDEVIGLVLVDATSEHVRAALTPEQWAFIAENTGVLPSEQAVYPELELVDFNAAYDAMVRAAAAQPLRQMPLVVLSRGREDELPPEVLEGLPPGFPDALAVAWRASQALLAALLPDARQVIATEASHYIQLQQPQVVIDAIRQVVAAVRGPASWSRAAAGHRDVARLVDIGGGQRMYLECRGQGSPTVVLESGYGNSGANWSIDSPEVPQPQVLPGVARFTRVCAYDRPGTVGLDLGDRSRSDPVAQPRTATAVVSDLHALLRAARVPGPYVLAGHSLGGMFVRLYAHSYPEEVVGLVLVDARPDGLYEQIERRLTPEQWRAFVSFLAPPAVPEGSPNDPFAFARRSGLEYYDTTPFNGLLREAARATPLRPMPLAVLASGRQWPGTEADFFVTWRAGQEELATIVPNARFHVAGESGHDIYLDQPALVTEAIRQVVMGVRDPETWYGLVSCCGSASGAARRPGSP